MTASDETEKNIPRADIERVFMDLEACQVVKAKGSQVHWGTRMQDYENCMDAGRLEIALFSKQLPKTTKNFRDICNREKKGYKGTIFHRVIKNFMMQGGDIDMRNGMGGSSIYGKKFPDEAFPFRHSEKYLLSMANSGPNSNGSQFFITFEPTPWLDNKHVVFGAVTKGGAIVDFVNKSIATRDGNMTRADVFLRIKDCGLLLESTPAEAAKS